MSRARTMQQEFRALIAIGAVTAALACASSVKVHSDFDAGYDFATLDTYAWMPDPPEPSSDPLLRNSLLDGRVRRAVDSQLAAKGIRKVSPDAAAFLVNYYVSLDKKMRVDTIPTASYGYGYGAWYGGYGGYGMANETRVSHYEEGTLVLDIADPETDKLIWRGTGATRVTRGDEPEATDKKVHEVVTKILDEFPPKQK